MRRSHIYLCGVAIATLGLVAAAPGIAQDDGAAAMAEPAEMSAEQQAQFESWPVDQQTAYELWPPETKSYYWSLAPEQQELFWRLTDEDKIALTAMTGPERDSAWEQLQARASTPPGE